MTKIIYICIAIIIWHVVSYDQTINFFVSRPMDTLQYAGENLPTLMRAFFTTLFEAAAGLVLAVIFSYLIGGFSILFPPLLKPAKSLFVVTQVLPIITLAPLFIALFGLGVWSKVGMVSVMCFFPVFIGLVSGIAAVKERSDDFLSMYNTPIKSRILRVYLPLSLPDVFVGLKVAATMAVLGAIVAEFLGAYYGLGKNLYRAPKLANAELMMSSAILTALMGTVLFRLIEFLERRIVVWEK